MTVPSTGAHLRLLTVHAHPDDEASKGSSLVARYREEGVGATLVCCTGGELGEILNPAMDRPEVREHLAAVRRAELEESAAIIGYDTVELLGYRDSGMPETPGNEDPRNFANSSLEEEVERLVAVIRRDRPQVVVTYSDDQGGYPHPDHLRVHEISVPAFERAGDPSWYPGVGSPWRPSKLYYSVWSKGRVLALHNAFLDRGLESPYTPEWLERFGQDDRITTRVDVSGHYPVREAALRAHRTQVDPASPFWFGLPGEVAASVYPWDDYILAVSHVPTSVPEEDLFAGVDGRR